MFARGIARILFEGGSGGVTEGPLVQRGLAARQRRLGDCDLAYTLAYPVRPQSLRHGLRRATSLCTREALASALTTCVGADSISARKTVRNHTMARRGQDPSLRHYFVKGCRGAHCAPVRFSGNTRFRGRTLFAPTATTLKAPLAVEPL